MSAYLEAAIVRNERRAQEVRERVQKEGSFPEGIHIGLAFYYLVGVNPAGEALYEHRNERMGGRSYWIVSPEGELTSVPLGTRPAGFQKETKTDAG